MRPGLLLLFGLVPLCPGGCVAAADDATGPAPYALVTETVMPHLEENLRYATQHYAHCVDRHWFSAAFASLALPVMATSSFEPFLLLT